MPECTYKNRILNMPFVLNIPKFWLWQSSEIGRVPSKHINVDRQRSSTLFQRWYLVENESWADVHLSTLFQRWQNNVDRITSIQRRWPTQCCFNVEIWLKMKVEPTYVHRRCFDIEKTAFKHFINCYTNVH